MKMKSTYIFPLILVIFFGGIMISNSLGWWQTESTKVPATIKTGDFEGMPDPGDIRGSYSFGDIEANFDIKADTIAKAFMIDMAKPEDILAKDLETYYGENESGLEIGTGALRLFVAYYVGLPYEGDDAISQSAVDILKSENKWSPELDELFEGRIIDLTTYGDITELSDMEKSQETVNLSETEILSESSSSLSEEHDEDEELVKGKTSVSDLMSWGISKEKIEEILTVKVENENMLIRDICTQNDLLFGDIKTAFNLLLEE